MKQVDIDVEKIFPCQIRELNLSCYGCCGRDFKSRAEIERDMKINTQEFKLIKFPSTLRLLQFRDRYDENPDVVTPSGLCSNVVNFGKGCIACPLHKFAKDIIPQDRFTQIHKKDLRENYCDVNYECETFKIWSKLNKKQKEGYVNWLSKRKFNHYDYSTKNLDGEIINKFLSEFDENK